MRQSWDHNCGRRGSLCSSNILFRNGVGLHVATGSAPEILTNDIFLNFGDGTRYKTNCAGRFEGNNVFANEGSGLSMSGQCKVRIRGNFFFEGQTTAILSIDSSPTISFNRIWDNSGFGVWVEGELGREVAILHNDIQANSRFGIRFCDRSSGEVVGNVVLNNSHGGIACDSGARPEVKFNFFCQNAGAAAWISGGAQPTFEANVLGGSIQGQGSVHDGHGLVVEGGATPTLIRNWITSNRVGVRFRSKGKGNFVQNFFVDHGVCVIVESDGAPMFTDNTIVDAERCGIQILDGGGGLFTRTHITGARTTVGVEVAEMGTPRFEATVIHDLAKAGSVGVSDGGSSTHEATFVLACAIGIEVVGEDPTFRGCEVKECVSGVVVASGKPTLDACAIQGSQKAGVLIEAPASCLLTRCKIFHNASGICSEGSGEVDTCDIYWNKDGVVVSGGDGLKVKSCNIYDHPNYGVHIREGSPLVTGCYIFDNNNACVMLDGGSPHIDDNRLIFPRDSGTVVNNIGAKARVERNLERNTSPNPPFEKPSTDRQLHYQQLSKPDFERQHVNFKRQLRTVELHVRDVTTALSVTVSQLRALLPRNFLEKFDFSEEFDFDVYYNVAQDGDASRMIQASRNVFPLHDLTMNYRFLSKDTARPTVGAASRVASGLPVSRSPALGGSTGAPKSSLPVDARAGDALSSRASSDGISFNAAEFEDELEVKVRHIDPIDAEAFAKQWRPMEPIDHPHRALLRGDEGSLMASGPASLRRLSVNLEQPELTPVAISVSGGAAAAPAAAANKTAPVLVQSLFDRLDQLLIHAYPQPKRVFNVVDASLAESKIGKSSLAMSINPKKSDAAAASMNPKKPDAPAPEKSRPGKPGKKS